MQSNVQMQKESSVGGKVSLKGVSFVLETRHQIVKRYGQ